MVPRRTLLLGLLTASSLMVIYILCVKLERPSWTTSPLKRLPFLSLGDISSLEEFAESFRESISKNNTNEPTKDNNVLDFSKSSSSSDDGSDKTRSRITTKAPAVKPQQPAQAARPTDPPYIGDTYMREDMPWQTHCPANIRSQVPNTEFRSCFLKDVPVLQWKKHATPENYRRLSKFSGTHGWGALVETLSLLNTSANWLMFDDWEDRRNKSECITCAVVGNGGILNNSRKGEEIDKHHYVFRTNGALTQGYEKDVGSRTTHYTFSTNTLKNSLGAYRRLGYENPPVSKETRYIFLPDHDRDYLMVKAAALHTLVERGKEQGKDPTKLFGEDVSAKKVKIYNPDFIRYIRNRFLRIKGLGRRYNMYRPSTGAAMLLAALHSCDKVSAYGFITPDYRNYSCYYFDKTYRPLKFYANHDMKLEMVVWQQLHKAGLIRLYMRE